MAEEFELSKILTDVQGVIELHLKALLESSNSVSKADLDNTYIKNLQEEFLKLHREKFNLKTELLSQKKLFISEIESKNKIIENLKERINKLIENQGSMKNITLNVEELSDGPTEIGENMFMNNKNKKVGSAPVYGNPWLMKCTDDEQSEDEESDDDDNPIYNQFVSLSKADQKVNPFPKNSLSYINFNSNPLFVDVNRAPEMWRKLNQIPPDAIKKAYPKLNWNITDLNIIKLKEPHTTEYDVDPEEVNPFPPASQAFKNYEIGVQIPPVTKAPFVWYAMNLVPSQEVKDAYPHLNWNKEKDKTVTKVEVSVQETVDNQDEDADDEVDNEDEESDEQEAEADDDDEEHHEEEEKDEAEEDDEQEVSDEQEAEEAEEEVSEEEEVKEAEEEVSDEQEVEEAEEDDDEEEVSDEEEEAEAEEDDDDDDEEVSDEQEAEEADEESEEELELEDVEIDGIMYLTTNTQNGEIYKCDDEGEILEDDDGEFIVVGNFKDGEAIFI